jgi:hypothetical protein
MLSCLLQKNSSVKHSLSIYLIIIIYFCSYNTGWDEKQVWFTRLITILFHETPSLSQVDSPPPIITFHKKFCGSTTTE